MSINFLALFAAALIPMVLGFIWYHPKLFGNTWMQASGMTEEKMKSGNMALIFGLSFVFSLILAWIMNLIAIHDNFIAGALFYETNGTMVPAAGSEAEKWLNQYNTLYAASNHTFKHGAFHAAFIAGICLALPIIATNALFERKGFKYIAINAGYWIITLTLMGGIIAAWR